jgi:pilus assembly protein Flp/PilA
MMADRFGVHGRERIARANAVLSRLLCDEQGQDLIEYALVAALIGLGAVASMKTLGTKVADAFTTIGTTLTSNV